MFCLLGCLLACLLLFLGGGGLFVCGRWVPALFTVQGVSHCTSVLINIPTQFSFFSKSQSPYIHHIMSFFEGLCCRLAVPQTSRNNEFVPSWCISGIHSESACTHTCTWNGRMFCPSQCFGQLFCELSHFNVTISQENEMEKCWWILGMSFKHCNDPR